MPVSPRDLSAYPSGPQWCTVISTAWATSTKGASSWRCCTRWGTWASRTTSPTALYLASDESTFLMGSDLVIDGGYTARSAALSP